MFCERQTFANFAMVDQFATIKSAKPITKKNTHDPCQNAIVRSQRVTFLLIWLIRKGFSPAKYSSNTGQYGTNTWTNTGTKAGNFDLQIHKLKSKRTWLEAKILLHFIDA